MGTGRIGENGPNAPLVNVSGGRGRNGPYPGLYGFEGCRLYCGRLPHDGYCPAPCGAGVGCEALEARRIARGVAKGTHPLGRVLHAHG